MHAAQPHKRRRPDFNLSTAIQSFFASAIDIQPIKLTEMRKFAKIKTAEMRLNDIIKSAEMRN
jgi:hypothetical protein